MSVSRKHEEIGPTIHPGEFLREEFMVPLGLSASTLANALHLPKSRIMAITREQRGLTAEMALRLSRYFGTTPNFWMNMQARYELESAKDLAGKQILKEVQPGPHLKTRQEPS